METQLGMWLNSILACAAGYLLGSIPYGLIIVKLISGKDVRKIASGRTGGTNAMRAAGFGAGLLTGLMDVFKGIAAGLFAGWLVPSSELAIVAAALMAVVGHNYSVFLLHKNEKNRLAFGGGAGGATCLGGAISLWPPIWLILLPVLALVFVFVGYASVATMSITAAATIVFTVRAAMGLSSWVFVLYGVISMILLVIALLPNIRRLRDGTERVVGLRAYFAKKKENQAPKNTSA